MKSKSLNKRGVSGMCIKVVCTFFGMHAWAVYVPVSVIWKCCRFMLGVYIWVLYANVILFTSMWASDRHAHLIRREGKWRERKEEIEAETHHPIVWCFPLSTTHPEDSLEVFQISVPGSGTSICYEPWDKDIMFFNKTVAPIMQL